ncbi:hypothetical protein OBBRIDRAFT_709735, partial [Obba rivulosa]
LLLYDAEHLKYEDIPHYTKMLQMIMKVYHTKHKALVTDVQSALGRVSFTTNIWSDLSLRAFIAITVHYCICDEEFHLQLQSCLL